MKKYISMILLAFLLLVPAKISAMAGVIAMAEGYKIAIYYNRYGTDYFALGTVYSYLPYSVKRGDTVYGYIARYGSQTLFDETAEEEISVYIETYDADVKEAISFMSDGY